MAKNIAEQKTREGWLDAVVEHLQNVEFIKAEDADSVRDWLDSAWTRGQLEGWIRENVAA